MGSLTNLTTAILISFLVVTPYVTRGQNVIERTMTLSDKVEVSWTADFDTEMVRFTVNAQSLGYIGFGLSPQGGMVDADVIIGGVDDAGVSYFSDRWATGKQEPEIDAVQNWFLLNATQTDTETILEFERAFVTCDDQDWDINNDTIKFIWSLGASDKIEYHTMRGVANVNILDAYIPPVDTADFDIWHLNVSAEIFTNTTPSDTSYWCTGHKSDKYNEKRHIVGFRVKLENELAIKHNHHMMLHQCQVTPGSPGEALLEDFLNWGGGECYEQDMLAILQLCKYYVFVWAKGGDPLYLPEDVGFPLNEGGKAEYFLLEFHYDNPGAVPGIKYETGLEILTAAPTRIHEAGLVVAGHEVDWSMIIPPNVKDYKIVGHCSSRCTQERLELDGISIFNVLLHSHLSGRKLKLRHFRPQNDGNWMELPWVSYDNLYDFNYQQNRPLRDHRKVLPGDQLTYECTYDSTWRQPPSAVLGGLSTRHEMCQSIIMYYPKVSGLRICGSSIGEQIVKIEGIGIEEFDENSASRNDPTVKLPAEFAGKNLSTVLTELTWTDELLARISNLAQFGIHSEICKGQTITKEQGEFSHSEIQEDSFNVTYPLNFELYIPPQSSCEVQKTTTTESGSRNPHSIPLILITFMSSIIMTINFLI